MKTPHLTAMSAALCALLAITAGPAGAQQHPVIVPHYSPPPSQGRMHGFRHFSPGFLIDREYVPVYVSDGAPGDTPAAPPAVAPPPPAPKKPYVIGRSYSSLPPGGCLKLIAGGSSYYGCSGEWYRQVGGTDLPYKAVRQP